MNIENIALQTELSYPIPEIPDHKEYFEYRQLLERIDQILKQSGLDLEFAERMQDNKFQKLQKRRAQSEGRIGIFKNIILDGLLYGKDFECRQEKVG